MQVVPEGEEAALTEPLLQVDDWSAMHFRELFRTATGAPLDRIGIPGVQDKVSARMISLPVARRHERHLLKLDPPEFPHLIANEAFFLEAARASGLRVPFTEVGATARAHRVFWFGASTGRGATTAHPRRGRRKTRVRSWACTQPTSTARRPS